MDIFINSEKIDFELENENNALDIVTAIAEYSSKLTPPQFITSIHINDREFSYADDDKLKKIELKEIDNIKIDLADVHEITILSLNQMKKFLTLLEELIIEKKDIQEFFKLNESTDWMIAGIDQISRIYDPRNSSISEHKKRFKNLCLKLNIELTRIKLNTSEIDENKSKELTSMIRDLNEIIDNIKIWLLSSFRIPDRDYIIATIDNTITEIDELLPKLENITILFQNGEDRETMNIIQKMASIMEKSTNMFIAFRESFKIHLDKYRVKEVDFETYFKSISDNLKVLIEAIQNSDIVIISDLLEYEFIPNIEEIKKVLLKIKEEAFTKAN